MKQLVLSTALASLTLTWTSVGAQPITTPAPLAELRDEQQLALALHAITQDPAIKVDDPKARDLAQALMTEGVKQLSASHFDQALANFLEAYAKFPSPKILLNIGSTLRDMGRPAEAANTYQRYLLDPATGPERVAEVSALLASLDEALTILTVRVQPRGAALSIDGGPFIPVGGALQTRARPGIHLIRIRKDARSAELTINGFEGEHKDVTAALEVDPTPTPTPDPTSPPRPVELEELHQTWMESDYHYTRDEGNPNGRYYQRTAEASPLPPLLVSPHDTAEPPDPTTLNVDDSSISSGALAVVRIDGKGRRRFGPRTAGAVEAVGLVDREQRLAATHEPGVAREVTHRRGDRGEATGGLGMPLFVFDHATTNAMMMATTETRVAVGVRVSAGVELELNGHLSVQADLGAERFFNVSGTQYEANAFVPTIGVIGRL
ncbi:MAG: hypothetical protein NT062_21250 [Proteobacteria bacterium]|nr:hypothetical protein [Pseudomonadota bacterium]